jgi:hypothetical protein
VGRAVRIVTFVLVGVLASLAAGCAPDDAPSGAGTLAAVDPAPRAVELGLRPDATLAAADELLARWRLGEAGTWRVDEVFSRTRPDGEVLTWDLTVVRRPPDVLVVGGGVAHGVLGGRVVVCQLGPEPSCAQPAQPVTFDPALALDGVLGPLGYVVVATGPQEIAGLAVDCFALTAREGAGERRLGDRAELCLSADGIPLRVVVDHGGFVDRREAVTVSHAVTEADVTALLAGA